MPQVINQIILRGAGSSIQRTPEQGGSFAHHFRWEQCPTGRHGCVRHLMSPAGCHHFSLDHFFLSLYSYYLLLALPSFVALISPAFPPASLFIFFFLHPPLPLPALLHLLSLFLYFPPSSDSVSVLAFLFFFTLISHCILFLEDSAVFTVCCAQARGGGGSTRYSSPSSSFTFLSALLCDWEVQGARV